jgi:TetR/AcrR family transcriptional regulator, transcriptional repressor for nem operon
MVKIGYISEIMSRNKDFSEIEALSKVADVFTRGGYNGTSLNTLTDELGIGKQSLYNAFGDKEELYLRALQHAAQSSAIGQSLVQPGKAGLERIQDFFEVLISECANANHPGCMVSAGVLEFEPTSVVGRELQRKWSLTQELLRCAIEDGQREGQIRTEQRSAELAQLLMATMAGLRVARKAMHDQTDINKMLRSVVNLNLELLRQ